MAAAEEERFTRRKHEAEFPLLSVEFCLKQAGLRMADIDILAYADLPYRSGRASHHGEHEYAFFRELHESGIIRCRSLLHKRALDLLLGLGLSCNFQRGRLASSGLSALRRTYGRLPSVRYYDHHRAHAAAAYLTSGVDRAAVATLDLAGGLCASVTWAATGTDIRRLHALPFYYSSPYSLGEFYSDCTCYLGFGEKAEGKTMGLASYGNRETYAAAMSSILNTATPEWYRYQKRPNPVDLDFSPRDSESVVRPPYTDFAAAAQQALEQAVARVVHSAMRETQSSDVCLGGGVALNCTSNGALHATVRPASLWIFPAAGDAGLSVGGALLCAAEAGELKQRRLEHAYLGPEYAASDCEIALRSAKGLVFHRVSDVTKKTAEFLAAGEIVGWFQGRMEFGPRALGNRSILADPRRIEIKDRVNRVKGREKWRPLSPVVLAEKASEFFSLTAPSPFMLIASKVLPEKQALIPAVTHVDGSARAQTVTRSQNSRLYDLISAFSHHTGIPVLLNTSFNTADEPIVCTPVDAIKTFLMTDLDVLVLGDYIVRKKIDVEQSQATTHFE